APRLAMVCLALAAAPVVGCGGSGEPVAAGPRVALLGARCWQEGGHVLCAGDVRNITDGPLSDVWAQVTLMDDDGFPQRGATGALDRNPLEPGQVSDWRVVVTRYSVPASQFQIEFTRRAGGRTLAMRDDRAGAFDLVAR